MDEIAGELREFLIQKGYMAADEHVGDEQSLLDLGIIDSLAVVELTEFMEGRYGCQLSDADLVPQNFESISAMASYLRSQGTA